MNFLTQGYSHPERARKIKFRLFLGAMTKPQNVGGGGGGFIIQKNVFLLRFTPFLMKFYPSFSFLSFFLDLISFSFSVATTPTTAVFALYIPLYIYICVFSALKYLDFYLTWCLCNCCQISCSTSQSSVEHHNPWYLDHMVTQNMLRTPQGK